MPIITLTYAQLADWCNRNPEKAEELGLLSEETFDEDGDGDPIPMSYTPESIISYAHESSDMLRADLAVLGLDLTGSSEIHFDTVRAPVLVPVILDRISDEYDDTDFRPHSLWKHYDLSGGDDAVDYNSGYLSMILDLCVEVTKG